MAEPIAPISPPGVGPSRPGPAEDPEHARGGWRDLLHNSQFLLMESSATLAGAGYAVYSVSVLFLAYGLSGNLLIAGAVLFIEYGVYSATFLVAPLVDRARDKRNILLVCYPIQAAAAAALALGLHTGMLSVPLLLGLVLVLALGWDFVWAVFNIAPRIVLPKRQLFVGSGFASIVAVGSQVGGYASGGALLYFIGPVGGATAYVVLLCGALIVSLPLSLPVVNPPATALWETFRRGWNLFRGAMGRTLRNLAALEILMGFFGGVPALLITAIAYQRFPHPASVYGALVTAFALGGSVAGIGIGHLNPRRSVGLLLVVGPVLGGLCMAALAPLSVSVLVIAGLLAGVGASSSVRWSAKDSWLQGTYPPEILGRLTSNLYLFTGVAGSVAVILVGVLSQTVPLRVLELFDGAGLVAAGLLAVASPSVRRMAF